ncbi:phage portal protein family protein [Burkholderia cepacia]|uniref:phage portal protein family protein n=1 Tax=Burkholderia cepacia TaxID=292 RepID=UPI003EE294E7
MVLDIKRLVRSVRGVFGQQAAAADTDPYFFGRLHMLPNPDPVLRAMGVADTVYASIMADAHVIGEVRSIRGEFRGMDYRVVTWAEDDAKAQQARDLCERWMQGFRPNAVVTDWLEIMWQMLSAIFTGYRVHELVWDAWEGFVVPVNVIDRPNRRFGFDVDAQLMLKTRAEPVGAVVEDPYRFIVSRHVATMSNPYGSPLLSGCFWPWTFKTGGWKYFVKFCERHGLPWPVARYGLGASEAEQDQLAQAIEAMIDSGYAVVPEGSSVELLVANTSGSMLPQESLINAANREMSKCLTGQAMIAELQNVGARAATETAMKRQSDINDSDRDIASASMSQIFRWITTFNFGEDVPSPELEFFQINAAGKDRAETYQIAANMGARPSRKAMLEELNIPQAAEDADALLPAPKQAPAAEFAAADDAVLIESAQAEDVRVRSAADAADAALEAAVIEPIARMLDQAERDGRSLADIEAELTKLVGEIDNAELIGVMRQALQWSYAQGYVDQDTETAD